MDAPGGACPPGGSSVVAQPCLAVRSGGQDKREGCSMRGGRTCTGTSWIELCPRFALDTSFVRLDRTPRPVGDKSMAVR